MNIATSYPALPTIAWRALELELRLPEGAASSERHLASRTSRNAAASPSKYTRRYVAADRDVAPQNRIFKFSLLASAGIGTFSPTGLFR